jgi:purine-nucleoside phosphorylase
MSASTASHGVVAALAAARAIRERVGGTWRPPVAALILGSGLGHLAEEISGAHTIAAREVPGFPEANVVGHRGDIIVGTLAARPVIALSGRFHMYEGHDARVTAFPVRVFHALGARTLIVSNAAGSVREKLTPGTLMLIKDHINLTNRSPLIGPVEPGDERFPDMSVPYAHDLSQIARRAASEQHVALAEGVYCCLLGPAYETPSEVRMLARIGADAVGMSTVPEVIVARALGMRVLGISCITNLACGLSAEPITHEHVVEVTAQVAEKFGALVKGVIAKLT